MPKFDSSKFGLASALLIATCLTAALAAPCRAGGVFALKDIRTNPGNTYYDIYDYSFPSLVSVVLLDPGDAPAKMLHRTVSYVNFFSTPGMYERYSGLGTVAFWDQNATALLTSGNLYCSEQSSLASMILEPFFPEKALHDTHNHTFHDVRVNGRWVIVDPMFDMRIENSMGLPATFEDVEIYLAGDDGILELPAEPLPRTRRYLADFRKEIFHSDRHAYGDRMVFSPAPFSFFLDLDMKSFQKILADSGRPLTDKFNPFYLVYLRNQIHALAANAPDRQTEAAEIQNFFLARIREDAQKGLAPKLAGSDLYQARNKALLGRLDEALAIFATLDQSEPVRLYQAQIHCLRGDVKSFDALAGGLEQNPYYRHMHYLLHGSFMLPGDAEFFGDFNYRWITKPPALDRPPFNLVH